MKAGGAVVVVVVVEQEEGSWGVVGAEAWFGFERGRDWERARDWDAAGRGCNARMLGLQMGRWKYRHGVRVSTAELREDTERARGPSVWDRA